VLERERVRKKNIYKATSYLEGTFYEIDLEKRVVSTSTGCHCIIKKGKG
jgi:hypothetical protein